MIVTLRKHDIDPDMVEIWAGRSLWTVTHIDLLHQDDLDIYHRLEEEKEITVRWTLVEE